MTGIARRATDTVSVLGFKLGWSTVRALPERAAYALFDRVADIAVRRGGKGIERLRSNYRRVRPELSEAELDALVREGMRSYMRYYCEAFRLPSLSRAQIDGAVLVRGDAELRELSRRGETAIVFVGHLGNFDLGAAWSAGSLMPVTTVAERLKPEEVYQEFVAFRRSIDMDIIPLTGGDDPFAGLLTAARSGGRIIALAADRDLTNGGVEVDLLGHRARMAKGPAVLSLMTGAPLFGPGSGTSQPRPAPASADTAPSSSSATGSWHASRARPVPVPPTSSSSAPTTWPRRSASTPRAGTCSSASSSTTWTHRRHRRPRRRPHHRCRGR